jgi:hypothetical protein
MRFIVLLLTASALSHAGVLEMSVSGPESAAPGITTVRVSSRPAPACGPADLAMMPGWPVSVSSGIFAPCRGVALADFDGDGRQEIIMPANNQVHRWKYDGTPYPGWPCAMLGDTCQYAAAVADVDLDGEFEVAVSTRGLISGGATYLIEENGQIAAGWPFRGSNGSHQDSPTLADLDGDDTLEIIVTERLSNSGKVHVLKPDGSPFGANWPATLDHVPAAGCGVADVDLDGAPEVVAFSYNSMYLYEADGTVAAGWPVTMPDGRNWSYQSPAIADLDGDDTLEIATAMHKNGGGVYVFRHDGTVQSGWPYTLANWTYCPPTVCDLSGSGELSVFCGQSGYVSGACPVLYGFDAAGSVLSGFPFLQSDGAGAEGNITVADLDGDADMEIVFTSNKLTNADSLGYYWACHDDGSPLDGWPLRPWGFTYLNGVNVADVDGDDSLDIIGVSEYAGRLDVSIWEAGVPFNRQSWQWPTYQFDMARTGLYQSGQSGVEEPGTVARLRGNAVAPNPVRAGGRVRIAGASSGRCTIYDRSGRIAAQLTTDAEGRVALPTSMKPGVYFSVTRDGRASLTVR